MLALKVVGIEPNSAGSSPSQTLGSSHFERSSHRGIAYDFKADL